MPYEPISQERLAEAKTLLDGGATVSDVIKQTGISRPTINKYFPRDPKPGGGGAGKRPTPKKPGATDEQLTDLFAKIASAPAIPAMALLHCEFCAAHFASTGPSTAVKLVELSRDHPALRSVMETTYKYWQEVAWATIIGTYLTVPLAHHLAPDSIYGWVQMPLGLPPRNGNAPSSPVAHTHAHANGAPTAEPIVTPDVAATPFGEMDMESLLRMAESFGIQVPVMPTMPPDIEYEPSAAETEPASEPAVTSLETESVTSDTDGDLSEA